MNTAVNNKSGFTIVELIIVVTVIAILAAAIIIGFNGITSGAREAALRTDLKQGASELAQINLKSGSFPASADNLPTSGDTNLLYKKTEDGYCLSATSKSQPSLSFRIKEDEKITEGVCEPVVTTVAFIPNSPKGVAIDNNGTMYATSSAEHRIYTANPSGNPTLLAGSSDMGYADGSGTFATFNYPEQLAIDSSRSAIYAVDTANNRIRKITPAGVVTTFAGSGDFDFADGAGASAKFATPRGIAIDSSGTVYVADEQNQRIRKITPAGYVTTLAGSSASGNTNGTGTSARFSNPGAIAVDKNNMAYVADTGNHRIRKVAPNGYASTLAGSSQGYTDSNGTSAQFNRPQGIAVDKNGIVYVADTYNNRIRKITPDGTVSTLAGTGALGLEDGLGKDALFNRPTQLTIDAEGVIYITDTGNSRIRKIVQ